MIAILLILIFSRPFISSLAFPYLNFVYCSGLLFFIFVCGIFSKLLFLKYKFLLLPVILFVLALFVSVFYSQNKAHSLLEIYKYVSAIFLFIIASNLSVENKSLVIRTVILSGLVVSFLAIYQYFFGFKHLIGYLSDNKFSSSFALDYLQSRRVFVPFVTPGILGGYLAMIIPLFFINKKQIWLILPVFFVLFLTMSIGAFFSLFATLTIFLCFKRELKKRYVFSLAGLFVLIAIIFIWRSMGQREHVQPVFSTLMRLSYWRETWELIKAHPLIGVGLSNFNLKMSRYAHNSYLQIWAEMGLLGLLSFLWLIYTVFEHSFKNLMNSLHNKQTVCLTASVIIFLLHNLLDFSFFLPEVSFIWWIILGLCVV